MSRFYSTNSVLHPQKSLTTVFEERISRAWGRRHQRRAVFDCWSAGNLTLELGFYVQPLLPAYSRPMSSVLRAVSNWLTFMVHDVGSLPGLRKAPTTVLTIEWVTHLPSRLCRPSPHDLVAQAGATLTHEPQPLFLALNCCADTLVCHGRLLCLADLVIIHPTSPSHPQRNYGHWLISVSRSQV